MITETQVLLALALNAIREGQTEKFNQLITVASGSEDADDFILSTMTGKMIESDNDSEPYDIEQLASLSRSITRQD